MKQWEQSAFYEALKGRPSEDGSLCTGESDGTNTEARKRCLRLLEYSPRTVSQLKSRLAGDGFEEEQIEDAIRYAASFGYVNDSSYAMEYVRTGCTRKSPRQLFAQLSQRGVDKEVIEQALDAYSGEQENTIRRLAEKRMQQKMPQSEEELPKTIRYLVSKGFPYEMSKRAVWECWEKMEDIGR